MPSATAPIRLTSASISRGQPSAPSVTNTTATASSPTFASNSQASGSSRPTSLFSSLLSGSTTSKPKGKSRTTFNPASAPSVASSSVSVSVSTSSTTPRIHSPPASSRAATIGSASTTTPSTTSRNTTSTTTTTATHPPTSLPATSTTATTLPPNPNLNPHLSLPHPNLHPNLPSTSQAAPAPLPPSTTPQPSEITQARHAILASLGNQLDRELGTRAAQLHANNAAIERQEREVARATDALARENARLGKLAETHTRKVKEIGNVQNWAEMLEREFCILEETLRLVGTEGSGSEDEGDGAEGDEDGSDGEGSGSEDGSGSGGWSDGSGSEWGGEEGGEGSGGRQRDMHRDGDRAVERDGEGDVVMGNGPRPEMVPLPASPPGKQSMIM